MLKCYQDPVNKEHQKAFNYRLMPTHRVVKLTFGRLKGRFHIIDKDALSNPKFVLYVAMVCCALHSVAERWACIYDVSWLPEPNDNAVVGNVGPEDNGEGIAVRNPVADSLRPVPNAH